MYVGHLPKGFNEEELKGYFTQYGKVTRLRLSRSKLTARPKGYGYIEFDDKETAQVASAAMNGYMMFGKKIDAHMVDTPHRELFKNSNRKFKYIPTKVIAIKKKNADKSDEEKFARV